MGLEDIENESLKKYLLKIKDITKEQTNFYRDNDSTYYDKILSIVELFQQENIENLIEYFKSNESLIQDFQELFIELVNYDDYYRSSDRKSSFYKIIEKLHTDISNYKKKEEIKILSLDNTLKDYENKFEEMTSKLQTYDSAYQILSTKLEEKIKLNEQQTLEIDKIKESAKNAENAFKDKHKLHASKEYWKNKSKRHRNFSIVLSFVFLLLVGATIFVIYINNKNIIDNDRNHAPTQVYIDKNVTNLKLSPQMIEYKKTLEKHELLRYMQYLFLLSIFIWISRIILKMIFSHLHLKEEAHEKETMILTYLALINEGAGLENEDRKLILEAIFRPSTNGLIKDESNVTLLDVVKTIKK